VDAFVYLRVRPGMVEEVVIQLENAPGVRAAVGVVGDWDVLAAVHGPDLKGIAENVLRHIHGIEGVERTVTAPVVPADVLGPSSGGRRTPVPMQQRGDACFVQIRTAPGSASELLEVLAGLEDVAAVALIVGAYDMIVEVPYRWEQAARVIVNEILPLPGIAAAHTLVAISDLQPQEEDRDQFSAWS